MKYDNMMASCCSQCMPVKIMLYLMELRKNDLYLYKCEPKKYTCRCRFVKHKIGDACVKL